jgi:uncharacterized membrane protein YedE/YeeE
MEGLPVKYVVAVLGFVLGVLFGATAHRTNFCTMGSISDIVFMQDWNRFRAWMLSIAVGILGSQFLHLAGYVDLNKSIYLTANFGWAGAIIGGALFGFGMTLAGGCGSKTLVRLGAGNLKSLIVALMIGIVGYMTMRGLFAFPRLEFEAAVNIDLKRAGFAAQGIPDAIAKVTGMTLPNARTLAAVIVAGSLLWFCFRSRDFRGSTLNIASGAILGAIVVAGWFTTGVVGKDEFEPTALASLTFVAPVGETVQYLMAFTGATINFGIATVFGVVVGAFLMAVGTRTFRVEGFTDTGDLMRHIGGGALMGFGGVAAMGCTIGQGMTGMSTLAMASVLALLGILGGGVFGMKYLEEGSLGGAAKALFARA